MSDRSKAVRASSWYFNELLESRVLLSPILFVGSQFSTGIEPRSVAVADLNADGKPDLVTANIIFHNVSVLLGNGNGTFQTQQTFAAGNQPHSVAVADLNADGKPDLVTANYNSNNVSVLLNTVADTTPPAVQGANFLFETAHQVAIQFTENVGASVASTDLLLANQTTGQPVPSGSFTRTYDTATNTAQFGVGSMTSGLLADGNYRATLPAGSIADGIGNALASDFAFDFYVFAGDAYRDRSVNLVDFTILAASFGQTGRVFSQGNFDYSADGVVNLDDFTILAVQFGKTLPVPSGAEMPSDLPRTFARMPISAAKPQAEELRFSTTRIIDDVLSS